MIDGGGVLAGCRARRRGGGELGVDSEIGTGAIGSWRRGAIGCSRS